jgi:hypothetical protein
VLRDSERLVKPLWWCRDTRLVEIPSSAANMHESGQGMTSQDTH